MNMRTSRGQCGRALLVVSTFGLIGITRLAAQSAAPIQSEVLQLDTLKVSTTIGTYKESTTSAGSKTPMEMKDIAGTVQVLNASFIADKLALSLEDLYPYVVGMTR